MIIYKLTSPSGKVYIGQSKYDLETRWQQHLWARQSSVKTTKLKHAFNKYDPETWTKEILFECDQETASFHEMEQIEKHDSFRNGYNMTLGGEGLNGADFSEEHRNGIAKAKKSWWDSPAGQARKRFLSEQLKINNPGADASRGKPAWNSGKKTKPCTNETKRLISDKLKGRIVSEESRRKMSASQKGKKRTQAHKDALRNARLGTKQTDKQKEAVRKANSAQWQIIHPDGKIEVIFNLNAFCREYKLDQSNLSRGKYKGYKAKRISEKET